MNKVILYLIAMSVVGYVHLQAEEHGIDALAIPDEDADKPHVETPWVPIFGDEDSENERFNRDLFDEEE